jgi:hypothetical protein
VRGAIAGTDATLECSNGGGLAGQLLDRVTVLQSWNPARRILAVSLHGAACAYLNGGPYPTWAAFQDDASFPAALTTDLAAGAPRSRCISRRAAAGPDGARCGGTVGGKPCHAYSTCHPRHAGSCASGQGACHGSRSNPGHGVGHSARRWRRRHGGRAAAGVSLRRLLDARTTGCDRATPWSKDRPVGPVSTLATQEALTAAMARRPSRHAARGLLIVGLTMVAGDLGERLVQQRLRPSGWDAFESPLVVAALRRSVGMAALGNVSPALGTNPKHPLAAGS